MEMVWQWLDRLTIVVGAISAGFAALAWYRSSELFKQNRRAAQRRRAPITIQLICEDGGQRLAMELPYRPRRDQLSRQELTGLLSFYYGEPRFDPGIVRRLLENGNLNRVLAGDLDASDTDELLEVIVDRAFFDRVAGQISGRSEVE